MKVLKVGFGLVAAAMAVGWLSTLLGGCAGAPTKVERKLFTIETNREPVVSLAASVVGIQETNESGSVAVRLETNRVWVTNYAEVYRYTPNATAKAGVQAAGGALGLLGLYGELASVVLGGILAGWGYVRSSKANKTATVLAQIIETGREILKSTPQGRAWEVEWKNWMIKHQAEAGVLENVMGLVAGAVDSPSAKEAARRMVGMMREGKGVEE